MGPKGKDQPETSKLGPLEAEWVANYGGWTNADTAKETGVTEAEAKEAAEAAAEDDPDTN